MCFHTELVRLSSLQISAVLLYWPRGDCAKWLDCRATIRKYFIAKEVVLSWMARHPSSSSNGCEEANKWVELPIKELPKIAQQEIAIEGRTCVLVCELNFIMKKPLSGHHHPKTHTQYIPDATTFHYSPRPCSLPRHWTRTKTSWTD